MTAYYNEVDKDAASWLRELIKGGHIAPGVVDTRSIEDVHPADLDGFTQCHFFAGIGVWSYALRRAGWSDDRPVWTGSCPCQPFSAAGQGAGFDDERHLWPAFHWLIQERRPPVVFGEQVASKDADPWIDLVHADLEALGYAFGAVPFPSAGVGAPHIRDRLYWVANATRGGRGEERANTGRLAVGDRAQRLAAGLVHGGRAGLMGNSDQGRSGRHRGAVPGSQGGAGRGVRSVAYGSQLAGSVGLVAHPNDEGLQGRQRSGERAHAQLEAVERNGEAGGLEHARPHHDASQSQAACAGQPQADRPANLAGGSGVSFGGLADGDGDGLGEAGRSVAAARGDGLVGDGGFAALEPAAGPTNGLWRSADWLLCRDGKWRPVEPGTFPLVAGVAKGLVRGSNSSLPIDANSGEARVMRLRGYGNAVNAEAARVFVEAVLELSA